MGGYCLGDTFQVENCMRQIFAGEVATGQFMVSPWYSFCEAGTTQFLATTSHKIALYLPSHRYVNLGKFGTEGYNH